MIEYLREENRVLRDQLGHRRVRLNDDQRRRLAAKAKGLGHKLLAEVATLVTPDTLLAWHRQRIAQKYDGVGHQNQFGSERVSSSGLSGPPPGAKRQQGQESGHSGSRITWERDSECAVFKNKIRVN